MEYINGNDAKNYIIYYLSKFDFILQILNNKNSNRIHEKNFNDFLDDLKDKPLSSLLSLNYPSFWLKSEDSHYILKAILALPNLTIRNV